MAYSKVWDCYCLLARLAHELLLESEPASVSTREERKMKSQSIATRITTTMAALLIATAAPAQVTLEHAPFDFEKPANALEQTVPSMAELMEQFGQFKDVFAGLEIRVQACFRNDNSHRERSNCSIDLLRQRQTIVADLRSNEVKAFIRSAQESRDNVDQIVDSLRSYIREVNSQIVRYQTAIHSIDSRATAKARELNRSNGEAALASEVHTQLQKLRLEEDYSEVLLEFYNANLGSLEGYTVSLENARDFIDELVSLSDRVDYKLYLTQGILNELESSMAVQTDNLEDLEGTRISWCQLQPIFEGLTDIWASAGNKFLGDDTVPVCLRCNVRDDPDIIDWLSGFADFNGDSN